MFVGHTGERIQPAARTSCKHHSLHLRSTDCICFPELPRCPLSSREKIAYYSRLTCTCGPVTWIETIDEYILIDLHSKRLRCSHQIVRSALDLRMLRSAVCRESFDQSWHFMCPPSGVRPM